jgi:hypothetical protein
MATTKTITLYTYDELSDKAKAKAREWYVEGDTFEADSIYEHAADAADILGINLRQRVVNLRNGDKRCDPDIFYSGFYSQGDGACFQGTYRYAKGSARRIRAEYPEDATLHQLADKLRDLQRREFYQLEAKCHHRGYYMHSGCMQVEITGAKSWSTLADRELVQLLRDFADWIYDLLKKEYEYQSSEEVVADSIRANGYTFTADGKMES